MFCSYGTFLFIATKNRESDFFFLYYRNIMNGPYGKQMQSSELWNADNCICYEC